MAFIGKKCRKTYLKNVFLLYEENTFITISISNYFMSY